MLETPAARGLQGKLLPLAQQVWRDVGLGCEAAEAAGIGERTAEEAADRINAVEQGHAGGLTKKVLGALARWELAVKRLEVIAGLGYSGMRALIRTATQNGGASMLPNTEQEAAFTSESAQTRTRPENPTVGGLLKLYLLPMHRYPPSKESFDLATGLSSK